MSHPFPASRRDEPFPYCPQGCVCGLRDLVTAAQEADERQPTEVDNAEMRALFAAVQSGLETIRADRRLAVRRHAAQRRYGRARGCLDAIAMRLDEGTVKVAAGEARQSAMHAAQGRRRPVWLRVIRWPVILLVGLFDVWYFTLVFQFLTSQTGDAQSGGPGALTRFIGRIVSSVPGMMIAVMLALCAVLLLIPLRAWHGWVFRSRPDDTGPARARVTRYLGEGARRFLRLMWWLLPIGFVAAVLMVVAVWSGLRAKYANPPEHGYPLASVILLLVTQSVGAIALKITADDPPAEQAAAARRRLAWVKAAFRFRMRRADRRIMAYESAWSDMRTLRDDLIGVLRVKTMSAWEAFILRTRALHRRAGTVAPQPAMAPAGLNGVDHSIQVPEFENIAQPRPELGPLLEICRLIAEEDPAELLNRKRMLAEEFKRQLGNYPAAAPVAILPARQSPSHSQPPPDSSGD
jgi:hypothetical protein